MTKDILSAAESAENLGASFVTRIVGFEKLVSERAERVLAEGKRFGKGENRAVVDQEVRNRAKREARIYRRELADGTSAERTERLKAIHGLGERVAKLAPLFENPVQLLSRMGLGSPERSRYTEQLRDAGPRELQNHADWATHTGDRILAAAVVSRLDVLPTSSRPFSATDLATSMVGEEFEQVQKAIARTRNAVQRALNANRDFERGRVDGTSKIGMGLAQRSVQ